MGEDLRMIALVSPDERKLLQNAGDRKPLSITYLSGALKENGIEHIAFDLNKTNLPDLVTWVRQNQPEYMGFTYLAPTSERTNKIISTLRTLSPNTKFITGGVEVTNTPHNSFGDFEVYGPGESKLVNILKGTNEEFDIDRYPNNPSILQGEYNYQIEGMSATTLLTSRGCPNKCVFCSVPEKRTKFRSLDRVKQEIDQVETPAVHIIDDSFLLDKHRVYQITDQLARKGLKYRIEARANHLDEGIVRQLKDTGCLMVAIGMESGNDEILRKSNKNETTAQTEHAVRLLGDYGIKSKGYFIIGLPGETESTARDTINFIHKLKGYGMKADVYPLCPYRGSPVGDNPKAYGIRVLNLDSSTYLNGGKDLVVPTEVEGLRASRIKELIMEARQ